MATSPSSTSVVPSAKAPTAASVASPSVTADVALMGEDLRHLPQVFAHARRSRRIMLQNVGLSLALITILIPLALFGVLGLAAVVLLAGATLVIALRRGR